MSTLRSTNPKTTVRQATPQLKRKRLCSHTVEGHSIAASNSAMMVGIRMVRPK